MTVNYETQPLTKEYYRIFAGVYSDFRTAATSDYKFEIQPLMYEDFVEYLEKGLIKCDILLENKIPTAFLAYTDAISESIELNVIHCLGNEDLLIKRKLLLEEFLSETEEQRKSQIVCYPMIGSQSEFVSDISYYGFKFVGLAVLRFKFEGTDSEEILKNVELKTLDFGYEIVPWKNDYFDKTVEIAHEAFKESSDALFDPRFTSLEGTKDIVYKITNSIYGEFLPEIVSMLTYNGELCGFCMTNITDGKIANVPLFAITPEHQGKGMAKHLLKNSIEKLLEMKKSGKRDFSEINTTTETDNYPALKMYRGVGFKEDYCYPQSYLPIG